MASAPQAQHSPGGRRKKVESRKPRIAPTVPPTAAPQIEIGDQAFTADGGEVFGAVREVQPDALIVYVENAGDFQMPLSAVEAVHSQKVIVDCDKLSPEMRRAIEQAHDSEVPGV